MDELVIISGMMNFRMDAIGDRQLLTSCIALLSIFETFVKV